MFMWVSSAPRYKLYSTYYVNSVERSVTGIYDAACQGTFPRTGGIYPVRPSTDAKVSARYMQYLCVKSRNTDIDY
jgi:hypothetical protein